MRDQMSNKKPFMTINVMGTEYKVYLDSEKNNVYLKGNSAFVATEMKKIYVDENIHPSSLERTIKHELVHAFLIESGLDTETWANNEEIVDRIALQLDKIYTVSHRSVKAFNSVAKYNKEKCLWEIKKENKNNKN